MQAVPPEQLNDVWRWARRGVEQVLQKQSPRVLPEDVYYALRMGVAWLYTVDDRGFLIVQRHIDADGSAALFVWIIWGRLKDDREVITQELNEMARKAQCRIIRQQSNRKGWQRAGWALKAYVYECEVI